MPFTPDSASTQVGYMFHVLNPSHVLLCCGFVYFCAYSGEQFNLTKLNDAYVSREVGSRRKLAPHHVDLAIHALPRQHAFPAALKDALRIARAMARVVAGYAPSPALPGFPVLFGRLKEVYDLVKKLVVLWRRARPQKLNGN
jgi:hypothetical protein